MSRFEKFFFCETYKQRMAKSVCVQLQARASVKGYSRARSLQKCAHCDQGKQVRADLQGGEGPDDLFQGAK